jgi:hypothetical protein
MKRAQVTMSVVVTFDPDSTNTERLADWFNRLVEVGRGSFEQQGLGQVSIGSFEPSETEKTS